MVKASVEGAAAEGLGLGGGDVPGNRPDVRGAVGGRLGVDGAWAVCHGRCLARQTTTGSGRCVEKRQLGQLGVKEGKTRRAMPLYLSTR